MEKTEQINQEVIKLWKELVKPDDNELTPLVYPTLNKDAELLFVGLNPSFGTRWDYLLDDNKLKHNELAELSTGSVTPVAWESASTNRKNSGMDFTRIFSVSHR